jgi:thiamine biosynthesis lipoprotein
MSPDLRLLDAVSERAASTSLSRRRFLAGLGLLAGAGVAAPLLGRSRSDAAARVDVTRPALGTYVRILVRHEDDKRAQHAIDRAFESIARVDRQLSIHRADSDIARANAAAGDRAIAVDTEVLDVVERARAETTRSRGAYDITVLPLMRLYGFYHSGRTAMPADREIAGALAVMGDRQILLDRAAGTLGLASRGAALDLGSIGKGWAVDRAVDALEREGVTSALVDVGRNVYGLGTPGDGAAGWSVGVLHPVTRKVEHVVVLRDAAIATSGNSEQGVTLSGVRVGHLFDARRGRPADGHLSASVQARTGTDSDIGSTTAFLLGPARTADLPEHLGVHFIG